MESGNSSSMQSSSGGDDQEYESSGGIIGSSSNYFLCNTLNTNTNTGSNVNATTLTSQYNNPPMFMLSPPQQPLLQPQSSHHQHQTNYLDALPSQSNYQNLLFWRNHQHLESGVGGGLADVSPLNNPHSTTNIPNISTHGSVDGAISISSSSVAHQQQSSSYSTVPSTSQKYTSSSASAVAVTATVAGAVAGAGAGASVGSSSGGSGKNPRKRTRASRRAPTTVLTTDTSNFRAMVQEFTGVPSSPFSAAASPLLSRRLTDLFTGSSSTLGTTQQPSMVGHYSTSSLERLLAGYNNNSSYNYPLRPSAHRVNTTNNAQQILNTSSNPTNVTSLGNNLTFQSLLQSTTSSPRYQPSSIAGAGAGLLPLNVGSFQDLSGVIGSDPVFGFAPMRLAPDAGGSSGGWRGGV